MSNAIRYDPLLVRYLAAELDSTLRGRACSSSPYYAADRLALLPLEGGEALEMDLHPLRGWIRIVPWADETVEIDATCTQVEAHPDERRLTISIDAPNRFRAAARRLEIELMGNQWNALLVSEEDGRIHSALWSRRAGERPLSPGAEYRPPEPSGRYGARRVDREDAWERWRGSLLGVAPDERERALVRGFAWTGTINARSILGDALRTARVDDADAALRQAFERWWGLRQFPPARPVVLKVGRRAQPYPFGLEGYDWEPVGSLLAAMTGAAEIAGAEGEGDSAAEAELLAAARQRLMAAERRARRLAEQTGGKAEAESLRTQADLLMAQLHTVEKGAAEVELTGWDGEPVPVTLDPSLTAAENAAEWYAEARKRERAAERLPALIAEAEREVERWRAAVELGETGALPAWVEREIRSDRADGRRDATEATAALPYRVFRSPGGLEIRVGRNSKANDQLTFGHSSPNDVWLHARSVSGSHVILRWRDPEGSPPARDLEAAARLAALHSKARTSAIVPVDWTRRKYVRKPRGAPPGTVVPTRVKTVFVEPGDGEGSF